MNRRELFPYLSLAPVLVAAAVVKEAQADEKPENDRNLLSLHLNNKYLNMSVGKDGNLWLKPDGGDWKRVVTEG